jgi:DNA polymerase III alpha subunit
VLLLLRLDHGFASLIDTFLNRDYYTTGVKELDIILSDSYNYLIYQESIMKFLIWCDLPEENTYDIIKKIAKKKFKEKEILELKEKLIMGFKKNIGNTDSFEGVWKVVEDAAKYSFNSSHSLSIAWDSIYRCIFKSKLSIRIFFCCIKYLE